MRPYNLYTFEKAFFFNLYAKLHFTTYHTFTLIYLFYLQACLSKNIYAPIASDFERSIEFINGVTWLYKVQSKVVRKPFSLKPLVVDAYFQLQNWFKKCKDLCYGIFKFQKSIL